MTSVTGIPPEDFETRLVHRLASILDACGEPTPQPRGPPAPDGTVRGTHNYFFSQQ